VHRIRRILEPYDETKLLRGLVALLQDSVESGASVGFLVPLTLETNERYWLETLKEVREGNRVLLVADVDDQLVGTVQLDLAKRPNGLHRAEVQKLLVYTSYRKQGLGQELMRAVEKTACDLGRSLLVLDTLQGDSGERLYERCGYTRAGVIPDYARLSDGSLHATVIFYKVLDC
jgi:GNAT superfamily N-acetyltransferase